MTSSKPYFIGIAGPTCSGKSLLANHLRYRLRHRRPVIISCDSYYRDLSELSPSDRASGNFDHPDSLEWELLAQHLNILARGGEILQPVYDFSTHCRETHAVKVRAGETIIVEGLFVLHRTEIRRLMDTKVFVVLSESHSISRRLERDVQDRGRTRESILDQFNSTVKVMMEEFVLPSGRFADIIVQGTDPIEQSVDEIMAKIQLPH